MKNWTVAASAVLLVFTAGCTKTVIDAGTNDRGGGTGHPWAAEWESPTRPAPKAAAAPAPAPKPAASSTAAPASPAPSATPVAPAEKPPARPARKPRQERG